MQQILTNLLGNAIKFTPQGRHVDVEAAARGRRADDARCGTRASGIAPAFLPHIFERFRQADAGHGAAVGGLGLGLSIVKELAERHGGWVSAESAGDNHGATFTVRIRRGR